MSRDTDVMKYFLLRKADTNSEEAYMTDDRFDTVVEDGDWMISSINNEATQEMIDMIAVSYLTGWGNAFYIRYTYGGSITATAYKNGRYGVERTASCGSRGGYSQIRKRLSSHTGIDTEPPEYLPAEIKNSGE